MTRFRARTVEAMACAGLVLCLSACSTLDEGQIDYYRSRADGTLLPKYARAEDPELILKSESVSVHLLQAFIKDFSEATDRFLNKVTFGRVKVRGEIAIIAKVFEIGTGQTADFTLAATKSGGRLIYYSGDVRPGGHFLNFSALPIYGPISYGGRPLMIQLTVLELDNAESAQIKSLLKTLAGIGAAAYPPASPVLAVLDRVGEQLLKGDTDDTEFRYSFVLHPTNALGDPRYAALAVGNYALVKEEPDRCGGFCNTPWSTLKLDPHEGRLVTADGSAPLFKDKTYLVVQVNKGFDPVQLDVAQAFSEFEGALLAQSAAATLDPGPIINEFRLAVERSVTFSRASRLLSRAASTRTAAPPEARELARDAIKLLQTELNKPADAPRVLSDEQIEALVRRLRLFPEAKGTIQDLSREQVKTKSESELLELLNL